MVAASGKLGICVAYTVRR